MFKYEPCLFGMSYTILEGLVEALAYSRFTLMYKNNQSFCLELVIYDCYCKANLGQLSPLFRDNTRIISRKWDWLGGLLILCQSVTKGGWVVFEVLYHIFKQLDI